MKKIYLACPYSHRHKHIKKIRTLQADVKAAELMEHGYRVFSPISHSAPIAEFCSPENNSSYDFWLNQDFWILEVCDELHVLCIKGWDKSKGVAAEIFKATELGIPIIYHDTIRGLKVNTW